VRAITTSSSPWSSVKQEGISYLAGNELPAVIVNMMRGGPGLGNIAPAQSDYFQATKGGGHGDYNTIVLAPSTIQEIDSLMQHAFELADRYRNPVLILGDGMLGQMMEPVELASRANTVEKDWILTGAEGRPSRIIRSLILKEGGLEEHNTHLQKKFRAIKQREVMVDEENTGDAGIVIVAYGTTARIAKEAIERVRSDGIKAGLIRPITLWPFPVRAISDAGSRARCILVVEMSAGQMVEDVRLAIEGKCPVEFYGRTGGGVPTIEQVEEKIREFSAKHKG